MAAGSILRVAKLKGASKLRAAAAHNLRAAQAERGARSHIDGNRTVLNAHLAGPDDSASVVALAGNRMKAAGIVKPRKNAVLAVEFLVSLPVDSVIANEGAFFSAAMTWLAERFGGADNILSADIHRDESAPHMHLLLLPLIGGRMVGSDAVGGIAELRDMQDGFFRDVCAHHGLKRYPRQLQGKLKMEAATAILRELDRRQDPSLRSVLWPLIRDHIAAAPAKFAELLGIPTNHTPKSKRQRTMTDIFISPGKGPKREPSTRNPIGFALRPAAATETKPYAL